MGNLSGTVRTTAARVLGHEPAGPLLSLALAAVVGVASLGVIGAAAPGARTAEPYRPRVTVRAELPERHRTPYQPPVQLARMPVHQDFTVYIVSSEEEAEQFRARISDENRTLEVLQRPQVRAEVMVAATPDDVIRVYRGLTEMDTLRGISGQSPINIIDMRAR